MNFELNGRYLNKSQRKTVIEMDDLIEHSDAKDITLYQRDYDQLIDAIPEELRRNYAQITLTYKGVPINKI